MRVGTGANDIYQQIKDRLDIVELVGEYVSLQKKSSNNYFGLCPFHNEKTPSFSVAAGKQIYYCFGCHKGGDVVNFVKEIEHLEWKETLQFLAKRLHLDYQPAAFASKAQSEALSLAERQYLLANKAAKFYYRQLRSGKEYLAAQYLHSRHLQAQAVNAFALGAAPASGDALVQELTRLGFSREEMLASTLVREKNGRLYDLFRKRLIFPILDRYDRVVAFGGRVFDDSKPKYINSPENSIYTKGEHLFAYNAVKRLKSKEVLVVEGYMDVVSLHQKTYTNAVAILGTALTPTQAHLLKLLNRTIILCLDNDTAGQQATHLSLSRLEAASLEPKVLVLSDAKDPDEYVSKFGIDSFKALLPKAKSALNWRLDWAYKQAKADDGTFDEQIYFKHAVRFLALIDNRLTYVKALKEVRKLVSSYEESDIDKQVGIFKLSKEYKELLRSENHTVVNNAVAADKHLPAAASGQRSLPEQLHVDKQLLLPQTLLNILWLLTNDNSLYKDFLSAWNIELLGEKFFPLWEQLLPFLQSESLDAATLLNLFSAYNVVSEGSHDSLAKMFVQENELSGHEAGKKTMLSLLQQLAVHRTKEKLNKVSWRLRNKDYGDEAERLELRENYQNLSRKLFDLKRSE